MQRVSDQGGWVKKYSPPNSVVDDDQGGGVKISSTFLPGRDSYPFKAKQLQANSMLSQGRHQTENRILVRNIIAQQIASNKTITQNNF